MCQTGVKMQLFVGVLYVAAFVGGIVVVVYYMIRMVVDQVRHWFLMRLFRKDPAEATRRVMDSIRRERGEK